MWRGRLPRPIAIQFAAARTGGQRPRYPRSGQHQTPEGAGCAGPLLPSCLVSVSTESCPVQLFMDRLVTSQWEDPATLGSVLVKVTSQETLSLALTRKVELLVVSFVSAAEVAFVRAFW